ncbi:MAG: hypothetical protein ACKO34_01520 [Vampirovibrionales bacterium]
MHTHLSTFLSSNYTKSLEWQEPSSRKVLSTAIPLMSQDTINLRPRQGWLDHVHVAQEQHLVETMNGQLQPVWKKLLLPERFTLSANTNVENLPKEFSTTDLAQQGFQGIVTSFHNAIDVLWRVSKREFNTVGFSSFNPSNIVF